MTCIVGIADGKTVYLGGDRFTGLAYRKYHKTEPKVFEKGEIIIGGAGDVSAIQTALHLTNLNIEPIPGQTDFQFIYIDILGEMIKAWQGRNKVITKDLEDHVEANFLIGFNGKLYHIGGYYDVMIAEQGYDAIGKGADVALGSLYTTEPRDLPPELRIEIALEAAVEHHTTVAKPFDIISIGRE